MNNQVENEAIIHSGQFMSSHVHEAKVDEEEEINIEDDSSTENVIINAPNVRDDNPVMFYKFGPKTSQSIAIDTSLRKVNKCLRSIYTEGVVYTPKWKHFQGLNLPWKERVRLNNVIWRAWFLQFVHRIPPKYCFFSIPEEDNRKPQLPIVEGMFWKRRNETIVTQYQLWRRFYCKRFGRPKTRKEGDFSVDCKEPHLLSRSSTTPSLSVFEDDEFSNWFTDTLFSNLGQPYLFPNPKEMAQAGNADIIQPGLVQLQPSLEEIMRTIDTPSEVPYDGSEFLLSPFSKKNQATDANAACRQSAGKVYPEEPVLLDLATNSIQNASGSTDAGAVFHSPTPSEGNFSVVNSFTTTADSGYLTPFANVSTDIQGMQYSMAKTWTNSTMDKHAYNELQPRVFCDLALSQPDKFSILYPEAVASGAARDSTTPKSCKSKRRRLQEAKYRSDFRMKSVDAVNDVSPVASTISSKKFATNRCSMSSASLQYVSPQNYILRPIPISLSRGDQSAFNSLTSQSFPLSPLSVTNSPVNMSVNQAPCSPMLSLYVSSPDAASSTSPKSEQMSTFQSNIAKPETPLLILQSMNNMPTTTIPTFVHCSTMSNAVPEFFVAADQHQAVNKSTNAAGRSKSSSVRMSKNCLIKDQFAEFPRSDSRSTSSSNGSCKPDGDTVFDRSEQKRLQHLQAEQFRRSALKNGFDLLEELLLDGSILTSKPTNAIILSKAADEIRSLQKACRSNETTLNRLNTEIRILNERISQHQSSMANSYEHRPMNHFDLLVRVYVKQKLQSNWKLWLLWQLMQPLYESYSTNINGLTCCDVSDSAKEWLSTSFNHNAVRPTLSKLLVRLATDSPILRDPSAFQRWAEKMIADWQ